MTAIVVLTCENETSPRGAGNTAEGSDPPIRSQRRRAGVSLPSTEQWRPIPGYEGRYEASDRGRIRSLPRPRVPRIRILRTPVDSAGYPTVHLWAGGGKSATHRIHQLVLLAFVGPPPAGTECIRHLDGDHTNGQLINLAYGTNSENVHDRVRHGTHHEAVKTHCPQNHPYDEDNTYRIPSRPNSRYCRTCFNARRDARRAAQRSAGRPVT